MELKGMIIDLPEELNFPLVFLGDSTISKISIIQKIAPKKEYSNTVIKEEPIFSKCFGM